MENDRNLSFVLHSGSIISRGFARSLLFNCHTKLSKYIPNLFGDMLEHLKLMPIKDVKEEYKNQYDEGLDVYIEKLVEENYGFLTTENREKYIEDDLTFYSPTSISNAIIDVGAETPVKVIYKIFDSLKEVKCHNLQLRFYEDYNTDLIQAAMSFTDYLEVIIPYKVRLANEIEALIKSPRLSKLVVYGIPQLAMNELNGPKSTNSFYSQLGILHTKKNPQTFIFNFQLFIESLSYNTFYNGKVSFDLVGGIRNAPNHLQRFGNIMNINLNDVLRTKEFVKLSSVKKDMIVGCRDCEYKYICIDSRFLEHELTKEFWFSEEECNYNPYIAQWEGEEGYQTVAESIADGVVSEEFVYRDLDV